MSYTVLTTQDRGGGLAIIPGPEYSTYAPQDFGSLVTIGRVRQDMGRSFWGFLVTDRENRAAASTASSAPISSGAPPTWTRSRGSTSTAAPRPPTSPGTRLRVGRPKAPGRRPLPRLRPQRQDLALELPVQGRALRSSGRTRVTCRRSGYQEGRARLSYNFYPASFFSRVEPAAIAEHEVAPRRPAPLQADTTRGSNFGGRKGLYAELFYNQDTERVGDKLLTANTVFADANFSPSAVFSRVSFCAVVGQAIDYEGARVGHGGRRQHRGHRSGPRTTSRLTPARSAAGSTYPRATSSRRTPLPQGHLQLLGPLLPPRSSPSGWRRA